MSQFNHDDNFYRDTDRIAAAEARARSVRDRAKRLAQKPAIVAAQARAAKTDEIWASIDRAVHDGRPIEELTVEPEPVEAPPLDIDELYALGAARLDARPTG